MKIRVKLKLNLNRKKAILMILKDKSYIQLEIGIDCLELIDSNNIDEKIENIIDMEIYSFKDELISQIKELKTLKNKLDNLMTWEIYEYGEKLNLWQLNERQKRLIN